MNLKELDYTVKDARNSFGPASRVVVAAGDARYTVDYATLSMKDQEMTLVVSPVKSLDEHADEALAIVF